MFRVLLFAILYTVFSSTILAQGGFDGDIPLLSPNEIEEANNQVKPYAPSLLLNFRDVYGNAAQWNLGGETFFQRRGLDRVFSNVYLLGMPMQDLENGIVDYNVWSGLNHVINNKGYQTNGLMASTFGFTGLGAGSTIDPRPHNQYDGFQVSYARSNRNYTDRLMLTYNTGYFKKGWNVSMSASKRYARTGYIEGTPYDSYSYFAAIEKRFKYAHSLTLTALGSWLKRGKLGPTTKEMYELAGTNLYNPNWGMQDGEIRNSRMVRKHQPMVALTHDWNISKKTTMMTSAAFLFGKNANTALDWYDYGDPRPDYYRKLPTWIEDTDTAAAGLVADLIRNDERYSQVDWARFYEANTASENTATYEDVNVNGVIQDLTGIKATILVQERREDQKRFNFSTNINSAISERFALSAGFHGIYQNKHFFQVVDDLMGGDFHINYNQFAERDATSASELALIRQHDIDNPDRVIFEGEKYGADYNAVLNYQEAWALGNFNTRHFDFFVSGRISHTGFHRFGNNRNGLFPEESQGKSTVQNFINYGVKGGLTYKINGRNFIIANALYETRPPLFENSFVSIRTRNQLVNNLQSETHLGAEAGYILRSDRLVLNFVGYYMQINDVTDQISFYNDEFRAFTNYTITNIDRTHIGIETAAQIKLTNWMSLVGVVGFGEHLYTDNAFATTTVDNSAEVLNEDEIVYLNNHHNPNSAELAANIALNFNHNGFFLNVGGNYTARQFISLNPVRRTAGAVSGLFGAENEEILEGITRQEQFDPQFSMDLFGGYTWYLKNTFGNIKGRPALVFNLGISNLTNNKDFIAIGFENNRFDTNQDVDRFQNRYFYGNGINYFANITYRFNK